MERYYSLLREATSCGLTVIEKNFKSRAKGMIKGTKIGIRIDMPQIDKVCTLSEEIGHYYTAVGDFTDQSKLENRKKERLGRAWAYKRLIPLDRIVEAGRAGIEGRFAVAEYLEVTESFLQETIEYYQRKHELYTQYQGYLIYWEPLLISKL